MLTASEQLEQQTAQAEPLEQQLKLAEERYAQAEKKLARMRGEAAELGVMDASALERLEDELQATLLRVQERRKDCLQEERLCGICMERPKNAALVPCGHTLCSECEQSLQMMEEEPHKRRCHICQQAIEHILPLHL